MIRNHHYHATRTIYPFTVQIIVLISLVVIVHAFPIPITHTKHHAGMMHISSPSSAVLFSTSISNDNSKSDPNDMDLLSYGERSRIYRRDVFSYDSWVEHRSTNRFVGNLFDVLKSGVFRQLLPNCLYMSSIALFIVMYNTLLVDGYDDFSGIHHDALLSSFFLSFPLLKIPGEFFSLCTPSLALLLGTCFSSWCVTPTCMFNTNHFLHFPLPKQSLKQTHRIVDGMKHGRIGVLLSIVHDPYYGKAPLGYMNVIPSPTKKSNC